MEIDTIVRARPCSAVERSHHNCAYIDRFISGQPSDYQQFFEIDLHSGQVRQIRAVDRARVKQFTITVQVSTGRPRSSCLNLRVVLVLWGR